MDASRTILDTARRILRRRTDPSDTKLHRYFGLHLNTIVAVWARLNARVQRARHGYTRANELLYALQFLRRYPKEEEILRDVGDASRYRRVVWKIVKRLPRVLPRVSAFFSFSCFHRPVASCHGRRVRNTTNAPTDLRISRLSWTRFRSRRISRRFRSTTGCRHGTTCTSTPGV
jgi:hypothetical protein